MRADRAGALPADVSGISIDSRSIAKGEAFFAIQGDNRDGHEFVDGALKNGAGLAVVARAKRAQFSAGAPLLADRDRRRDFEAQPREPRRDRVLHARLRAAQKVPQALGPGREREDLHVQRRLGRARVDAEEAFAAGQRAGKNARTREDGLGIREQGVELRRR